MSRSLLDAVPQILPRLDPDFRPAFLATRNFLRSAKALAKAQPLNFALEREGGKISRFDSLCFKAGSILEQDNFKFAERALKFLLWSRGAQKVYVQGPEELVKALGRCYSPRGERAFDADFFCKVYGVKKFEILYRKPGQLPKAKEGGRAIGGHLKGCRIGFDAGGSDRKVAALIDGNEVFSTETVWEPKLKSDPRYHIEGIRDSIRQAAAHLPHLDAIGVSSAGIFVDNQTRVASLFRKVPEAEFKRHLVNVYPDLGKIWKGVPVEVANDGDVTALAGAMDLKDRPVFGIAMGTSEAVGYVDAKGRVTGWLNELAFAPIDYAPTAPLDSEWSGDRGTGVNYLSQDAAIRLAAKARILLDATQSPGQKLKLLQALLTQGDERAQDVFQSMGVYLGYALLHYADFYPLKHVLVLGRVSSGAGGPMMLEGARKVIAAEDPLLARRIHLHLPDEAKRRVGQAVAAASLPQLNMRRAPRAKGHSRPRRAARKRPSKARARS